MGLLTWRVLALLGQRGGYSLAAQLARQVVLTLAEEGAVQVLPARRAVRLARGRALRGGEAAVVRVTVLGLFSGRGASSCDEEYKDVRWRQKQCLLFGFDQRQGDSTNKVVRKGRAREQEIRDRSCAVDHFRLLNTKQPLSDYFQGKCSTKVGGGIIFREGVRQVHPD